MKKEKETTQTDDVENQEPSPPLPFIPTEFARYFKCLIISFLSLLFLLAYCISTVHAVTCSCPKLTPGKKNAKDEGLTWRFRKRTREHWHNLVEKEDTEELGGGGEEEGRRFKLLDMECYMDWQMTLRQNSLWKKKTTKHGWGNVFLL